MRKMKLSDDAGVVGNSAMEDYKEINSSPSSASTSAKSPIKRRVSQKNSGILEPENLESVDEHYILSVLDPTDNRFVVWVVRFLLFWGVYFVCGFYITFGANPSYWAIGLGGVAAYCLCIGAYLLEAYVFIPWWYESHVGKPMVHWLSWAVFLDIVYHVINPRNLKDCRVEVYAKQKIPVIKEKCKNENQDYWLDFCADVGDGFNPTFAVFSAMARSHIKLEDGLELPRADALVVGGDIAYPWPRHEDLLARFLRPLSWAYPEDMADVSRNIFIMPGNHEWADGLRNFRRVILGRESGKIGGWTIGNRTSYFAIQLPHNWWMFCVDPGNEVSQDLDEAQIEYFRRIVCDQTSPNDRFILAVHEPDWIKNSIHGFDLFKGISVLREEILGERLRVTLAGDLHYYRRMEETAQGTSERVDASYPYYMTNKKQLVVAGHGGAFAHPTYVPSCDGGITLNEPHLSGGAKYHVATDFPTPQDSRATFTKRWRDGFSFGKNYGYGSILAMSYIGMTLAISPLDYSPDGFTFPSGHDVLVNASYMLRMLKSLWFYPSFIFLAAIFIIFATASQALKSLKSKLVAFFMSMFHLAIHMGFLLASRKLVDAAWAQAIWANSDGLLVKFDNTVLFCFLSNVSIYVIGYFLATSLTSVYMYIAMNVLGVAYNEPMSTIEYQEDKGFCRLRFTPSGDIEFFSVGIRKVPRKWIEVNDEARTQEFPAHFKPGDIPAVEPFIVERVYIKRDGPSVDDTQFRLATQ